jgi:polyisoprenoid-binding protein YceI
VPGSWSPVSNFPKVHEISKIISGGHFIFAAYDTEKGELLYTGGGTCILNGSSDTEHVDFGDKISAGIVGKDQQFTVKIDGDTFMQAGTLSNGKGLSETWKRVSRER